MSIEHQIKVAFSYRVLYFVRHFTGAKQYMTDFDDIRPYYDEEVRPTLERLLDDNEFLDTIARLKSPKASRAAGFLLRPIVRSALRKELKDVHDVASLQNLIWHYMNRNIKQTITRLSSSGLERLDQDKNYLFISNHRDIAMDSAMVNWQLYNNDFGTLRIAAGDNLLTKPYASDLMRLNKSFIVNRSAKAPREKLKAAKKLSSYIHFSLFEEKANIWIAQREGRAKDGLDHTNSAIISMLALNKDKSCEIDEYFNSLNVVPVSISYEYDPCDAEKARELTLIDRDGGYEKDEHEDVKNIARGITGFKGNVHVAFGEVAAEPFKKVEDIVAWLDNTILENYVIHPTNCIAFELLENKSPKIPVTADSILFTDYDASASRKIFKQRLDGIDSSWHRRLLETYANPVYQRLKLE